MTVFLKKKPILLCNIYIFCGWGDYMRKRVMRECGERKGRENEVSGWEREWRENVLSNGIERKW